MATRRTHTRINVPVSDTGSSTDGTTMPTNNIDLPPPAYSPWLPTFVESVLLAIYPITLIGGSIAGSVMPSTRAATYLPYSQSYDPKNAPSYFAKKSNIFNVYFVKIGWVWITAAFFTLIFTHPSLGPTLVPRITRRRLQATARYLCVTTVWIFVTQWFFGPPIVDRGFRWTGGKCAVMNSDSLAAELEREDMSKFEQALTHAACKAVGGYWRGGHDISGHVFLLILGSTTLWLELLPAVLRMGGFGEERRIYTFGGLPRLASVEAGEKAERRTGEVKDLGVGVKMALGVAGLSWWMLLMTAAYFHTWFEKVTGLLVAFAAVYAVYFLPRAIPPLRKLIGMPGV